MGVGMFKKRGTLKNKIMAIFLISMVMVGCGEKEPMHYSVVTDHAEIVRIAADDDESTVVIDLRNNREYEAKHLIGAINVPYDEDGSWLLEYLKQNAMEEKSLYLMCGKGKKSAEAFNLLVSEGYRDVHYVSFGFDEYAESEGEEALEGAEICDCYLE